jgi:hypothetical protein
MGLRAEGVVKNIEIQLQTTNAGKVLLAAE